MKPNSIDGMMAQSLAAGRMNDALQPTRPDPSMRELQRQNTMILELFRRLDTLAAAIIQQKPPLVNVEAAAAPQVTVEAAKVTIPAPIVNVAQPDFKMENATVNVAAPVVNVAAPDVTVNPPQVHVSAPNVTVAAPAVTVAAANYTAGDVNIPYPKRLSFQHFYDDDNNITETVVTATE